MKLFEKLALARQIEFKEGQIVLLKQNVVFSPAEFFAIYCKQINDSPEQIAEVYKAAKQAVGEGFAKNLGSAFSLSFKDYAQWLMDLVSMSGWGKPEWLDLNLEKTEGVIKITDSTVAKKLVGQVNAPVDHVIRGLMAGGATHAFQKDVDIIETQCIALKAPFCKFIIRPLQILN